MVPPQGAANHRGVPRYTDHGDDIVIGKIMSSFSLGAIKGIAVAVVIFLLTPFRFPFAHFLTYCSSLRRLDDFFLCGTICGTVIEKPENIGRVQGVVIVPLIFMSGIFFPLSSYPEKVLPFVRALPTTAIFEAHGLHCCRESWISSFALPWWCRLRLQCHSFSPSGF